MQRDAGKVAVALKNLRPADVCECVASNRRLAAKTFGGRSQALLGKIGDRKQRRAVLKPSGSICPGVFRACRDLRPEAIDGAGRPPFSRTSINPEAEHSLRPAVSPAADSTPPMK